MPTRCPPGTGASIDPSTEIPTWHFGTGCFERHADAQLAIHPPVRVERDASRLSTGEALADQGRAALHRDAGYDWDDLGSPSGRISGVVKNTPSGVGLGVGVTATCGPAAERSWMRMSRAKSSCTVLTPSGVGLGVGVTATCGRAAERSWMRMSRAMSSCTVLTPSGVGLGVGVTATCGPAAERSWMRMSRAKSSCTVLWQWLT